MIRRRLTLAVLVAFHIVSCDAPQPSPEASGSPMSSLVASEARHPEYAGWYRDVRFDMWTWEGADPEILRATLARIESAPGERERRGAADTLITNGPGHWVYEFAASGEVAFAEGVAHERVADRRAADEAFGRAAVYFAIASYPHLRGRHARAALARAYESYARAGDNADVPLEIWEMQLGDVSFPAFVHLPAGVGPFAVVLKTGGMDVLGIEFRPLAQALNDRGIAMIAFDVPGTGNDGIVDADAQAHHEAVLDRVVGDPRFDPQRIAVWSESLGGIPAVKVAIERRDQLAAVVNGCGVLHALHVFEVAGPEEAASYAKAIEAYDAGDLNRLEIAAIELRIKADPQFRALQSSFQFPVYVDRVRAQPGSPLDLGSRARRISLKHQGLIGGTVRTPVPLLTINTQADPYVPVSDSVMATQASRRGTLALFGDHDGHCLARSLEIPAVLAWLDPILGDAARSR